MAELIQTPGLTVENSGVRDDFDRPLIVLLLSDCRTVGQTLIAKGLARLWLLVAR